MAPPPPGSGPGPRRSCPRRRRSPWRWPPSESTLRQPVSACRTPQARRTLPRPRTGRSRPPRRTPHRSPPGSSGSSTRRWWGRSEPGRALRWSGWVPPPWSWSLSMSVRDRCHPERSWMPPSWWSAGCPSSREGWSRHGRSGRTRVWRYHPRHRPTQPAGTPLQRQPDRAGFQ